jgi:SpoVK/Ycf46/Vps4 family AAA+-type ATPase
MEAECELKSKPLVITCKSEDEILYNMEDLIEFILNRIKPHISEYPKMVKKGQISDWIMLSCKNKMGIELRKFEYNYEIYSIALHLLYKSEKLESPKFSEIYGYDKIKNKMKEFFNSDIKTELIKKYKVKRTAGMLLYGPPGCGKSYMSKSLKQEFKMRVLSLDSEVFEKYSSLLLEIITKFDSPLIFMDEIDSLATEKDRFKPNAGINFLKSISDLYSQGLSIISTSNYPLDIKHAFIRSGRIDTLIYVSTPTFKDRITLFKSFLKEYPITKRINYKKLAEKTDFYSPSDIKQICYLSSLEAFNQSLKNGKEIKINQKIIESKIGNSTAIEWFEEMSKKEFDEHQKKRFKDLYDDIERYKKFKGGMKK